LLKPALVEPLLEETEELIRIFGASLRTALGRGKKPPEGEGG